MKAKAEKQQQGQQITACVLECLSVSANMKAFYSLRNRKPVCIFTILFWMRLSVLAGVLAFMLSFCLYLSASFKVHVDMKAFMSV